MNTTLELMRAHRSIRRYEGDEIPDAHVRAAVEAGQAASTSSNVQSYCLIRVRDVAAREKLIALTGGQDKVAESGAFFVVCGDTRRHRLAATRDGRTYDAGLEAFLLAVIDATLFAQNLVLGFESLGYGICYIGGLRNDLDAVDELLEIPEGIYPLYGLCVGIPAESPTARPRLPVEAILFDDRYPDDETMLTRMGEYDDAYVKYLEDRGAPPDKIRPWSATMGYKFSHEAREAIAAYYARKGARFD